MPVRGPYTFAETRKWAARLRTSRSEMASVTSRTYLRNLVAMFLWQAGNYIAPLVTLPYLARVLGPHAIGEVALAGAVAAYFVLVTDWSFGLTASRLIAQSVGDPEALRRTFWGTLTAKVFNGVACLVLLAILTLAVPELRAIAPLIAVAAIAVLANVVTLNWCLQGLERLDLFAGAAMAGKLATIPLTLLLVHSPDDAWLAILVQTGTSFAAGCLSILLVRRLGVVGAPLISVRAALAALRHGWHVFLSGAATSLYTTSNVVILAAFATPVEVGFFSGADRLRAAAQGLINPLADASYPRVARLLQQDQAAGFAFVRKLILAQGTLTLCIALALFAGAPLIVDVILGPEFGPAVEVLRIMAWVPFVVGISNVFAYQVLLQSGRHYLFSRIILASLPVGIGLIVPLTWVYHAPGAALGALLTEIVIMVAIVVTAVRTSPLLFPRGTSRPSEARG